MSPLRYRFALVSATKARRRSSSRIRGLAVRKDTTLYSSDEDRLPFETLGLMDRRDDHRIIALFDLPFMAVILHVREEPPRDRRGARPPPLPARRCPTIRPFVPAKRTVGTFRDGLRGATKSGAKDDARDSSSACDTGPTR